VIGGPAIDDMVRFAALPALELPIREVVCFLRKPIDEATGRLESTSYRQRLTNDEHGKALAPDELTPGWTSGRRPSGQ
jgi:hypothetical protein